MFARALASSSRTASRALTTDAPRAAYFVERTTTGQLPVYSDIRNGGNNRTTLVRRVRGNVTALRNDLAQYLADGHLDPLRPAPSVSVRPTSGHVVIKGHAVAEVKAWLEMRGF